MKNGIFKVEKKILELVEENLHLIVLALAVVFGIAVRLAGADYVSGDYYYFLDGWFEEIRENGLAQQVGNYNLAYQFCIWLLTKLPWDSLYAYKILSCIFDFGLAFGAGLAVYAVAGKRGRWRAITAFCAVLLSPVVVINSSVWAQCDAIFTFFAVMAIVALIKEKYISSMILLGVSIAFKLQGVFFLPAFLLVWFIRKRFSVCYFAIIPVALVLSGLPTAFFGRNLLEVFDIYLNQTGTYPYMAMNYASVWNLLLDVNEVSSYELMKVPSIALAFSVVIGYAVYFIKEHFHADGENVLYMAFLLTFACVLILPAMHERYSYGYEVLAICIAVLRPKTAPLCVGLHVVALASYSPFIFGQTPVPFASLALINIGLLVAYSAVLIGEMKSTRGQSKS